MTRSWRPSVGEEVTVTAAPVTTKNQLRTSCPAPHTKSQPSFGGTWGGNHQGQPVQVLCSGSRRREAIPPPWHVPAADVQYYTWDPSLRGAALSRVKKNRELAPLQEGHKYPLQGQEIPTPLHLKLCIKPVLGTTAAEMGNPAEGHPSPPAPQRLGIPPLIKGVGTKHKAYCRCRGGGGGCLPKLWGLIPNSWCHGGRSLTLGCLCRRPPPSADGVLFPHTRWRASCPQSRGDPILSRPMRDTPKQRGGPISSL